MEIMYYFLGYKAVRLRKDRIYCANYTANAPWMSTRNCQLPPPNSLFHHFLTGILTRQAFTSRLDNKGPAVDYSHP